MRPAAIFRSIRWRLQLWYGALFAAVLTGLGVAAYQAAAAVRRERTDDELERRAVYLSDAADRGNPPAPTTPPPPRPGKAPPGGRRRPSLDQVLTPADEARGFYYAVWRLNREPPFLASAGAPPDIKAPPDEVPKGQRQRGMFREVFVTSNPGDAVLVGRSIAADRAELHRLGLMLAGGGLAIFAVTLLIGGWLVQRALRPIRDISDAAAKIAAGDLARRIDTRDTESELGAMAGVLNETFGRLEAAFAQQARFTADAAHELRTPVTVILTHVQNALAEGGLSEEQREAFEACQRAAQRMRRMIESLLQLARLDAGQEKGRQERVDLAQIGGECLELMRPLAAARRIAIREEWVAAECHGDAGQLGQVITNLIGNAIHHGPEGGEVRVSSGADESGAWVVVKDNGPGIAPEHAAHIFERFYRVDKARTAAAGRTGLGLAISKAIVDAHGGTITVESAVGEGATFTVRVPRG